MSEVQPPRTEQWSFSLRRLMLALGLFGIAIACWRELSQLQPGGDTLYLGAFLLFLMVLAASTGIGAIVGRVGQWVLFGFLLALPLAAILMVLFWGADV